MCDSVKKFEITAPKSSVTKSWCLELIEGLKEHFDDLKDCIKDVKISLKEIHRNPQPRKYFIDENQ